MTEDITLAQHWIALPGSQQLFLSSPIFETLFEGSRGPGKTDSLLMDFAQHCGQGFGANWRGILFRQTYKQLSDIIAKSKRWFPRIFGRDGVKYNSSTHTWVWATGEELLLRQMKKPDDYWDYHGHEYPWIGFEELTNWPNADCYESMKACSRSSWPGMPRKYRATCNPFGVGHNWVKAYFIDPAPRGTIIGVAGKPQRVAIHGSILENKILLANDPEYLDKLRSITSTPKRLAWLYGHWDIVAGGMFDDVWDSDVHLLEPFAIPPSWRVFRALDWGSSKPFSVGWWARSDGTIGSGASWPLDAYGTKRVFPPGTLLRIAEWYGYNGEPNVGLGWVSSKVATEARKLEEQFVNSEIGVTRDRIMPGPADGIWNPEEGNDLAANFANEGMHFAAANKTSGSRRIGWELMRTMLGAASAGNNEEPGMYCLNNCRNGFVRTVPSLPRDLIDMDDVDTDAEDHCGDESRYMALHQEHTVTVETIGAKH